MPPEILHFALPPLAYLFGSVSSAVITCRALALPDPRAHGSRNPGATNVLRTGGAKAKKAAAITLAGDWLKGLLPVLLARALGAELAVVALCGFGAFLGHLYPLWFGFRGGKGVAVAAGAFVAISPAVAALLLAAWLAAAFVTRYSSVASLSAATLAPWLALRISPEFFYMSLAMAALMFWRHRGNLRRLAAGEEGKIRLRSQSGEKS